MPRVAVTRPSPQKVTASAGEPLTVEVVRATGERATLQVTPILSDDVDPATGAPTTVGRIGAAIAEPESAILAWLTLPPAHLAVDLGEDHHCVGVASRFVGAEEDVARL